MSFLKAALACVCIAAPASAETLYGVTSFTEQPNATDSFLVSIDTKTGATSTKELTGAFNWILPSGLTGTRDGRLLALNYDYGTFDDNPATLNRINTRTGKMTAYRTLNTRDHIGLTALDGLAAIGNGKKALISTFNESLVYINGRTGRARLGPDVTTEFGLLDLTDISFGGGKLYGVGNGSWYEIDRRTGAASEIGYALFLNPQTIAKTKHGTYGTSTNGVLMDLGQGGARTLFPSATLDYLTALHAPGSRRNSVVTRTTAAPAPVPIPAAGALLAVAIGGFFGVGTLRRGRTRAK